MTPVRILIGFVVLGALVALGAYWIGPGVVPRAELHLLALDVESRFAEESTLPAPDSTGRQPLILAVSNTGERETSAGSLTLAVPGWIRLFTAEGPVEPTEDATDEPLRQYVFALGDEAIEPGALPQVPSGLDRMWLVADVPALTCRIRWDGVPEFMPSPPWDRAALTAVSVFYSMEDRRSRHTGVLVLHVDPATLSSGDPAFSAGETSIQRPGQPLPATDSLVLHGERSVDCGAPEHRVRLETTVWRTGPQGRGRLFVIRRDTLARRLLFDRDGDGRIEREAWDGDGDGLFEASRTAAWAPPSYLLPTDTAVVAPLPAGPAATPVTPAPRRDTTLVDTSAAQRRDTTTAGRVDTTAVVDTLRGG